MVKITVDVDSETYFKLKRVAESRGISVYTLVKEALYEYVKKVLESCASSEASSSKLSTASDPPTGSSTQERLANVLKWIVDSVKDLDERVAIIERMHWGVNHINKRIQVYEEDSEEGKKILEEIEKKGLKPIEKSEDNRIAVEVYNT